MRVVEVHEVGGEDDPHQQTEREPVEDHPGEPSWTIPMLRIGCPLRAGLSPRRSRPLQCEPEPRSRQNVENAANGATRPVGNAPPEARAPSTQPPSAPQDSSASQLIAAAARPSRPIRPSWRPRPADSPPCSFDFSMLSDRPHAAKRVALSADEECLPGVIGRATSFVKASSDFANSLTGVGVAGHATLSADSLVGACQSGEGTRLRRSVPLIP